LIISAGVDGKIFFWNSILEPIKSFTLTNLIGKEIDHGVSVNSVDLYKCSKSKEDLKDVDFEDKSNDSANMLLALSNGDI
jgi:hypothetical protein